MSNEETVIKRDEDTGDTIMQKPVRYQRAEPTMQELAADEALKEREGTTEDLETVEQTASGPEDESFKKRYGDDWEDVLYATATKLAMSGDTGEEEND